ncbi:50S ribosomal protein L5 [Candidatus Peregrinibacteria bacterium CG10_big_fil_rev_8_21_14_0_10_55_24]|nr:MAG: 50S ribosomal protein L5 [Candidatus Peregrinibacteria bacterium CG10_big_fil_rev_8_21_14_0_10_55_24]
MAYASLHDRLRGPIAAELKKELKIANTYALPRLEKVVVNVGINRSKMDRSELHEYIEQSLAAITGQKPVFTRSRKAISNFKTRKGLVVGAMVTLRGRHMEEFLDRLIGYILPRIRDFRGLPTKLDGHGNYAIGIRDHSIFPEVPLPDAKDIFGLQVQITTTAKNDEEAQALLKHIGMPFRPEKKDARGAASSPASA